MAKLKKITQKEYLSLAKGWVFTEYTYVNKAAAALGISRATLKKALKGISPMPGTIHHALNFDQDPPTYTERLPK